MPAKTYDILIRCGKRGSTGYCMSGDAEAVWCIVQHGKHSLFDEERFCMGHRDDGTPQCSSCQRYAPRQALHPWYSQFKHHYKTTLPPFWAA